MHCKDIQEDLGAWLDGALPSYQSAALSEHVHTCQACSAELDVLEGMRSALQQADPIAVPPTLIDRLVSDPGPSWWFASRLVYTLALVTFLALAACWLPSRWSGGPEVRTVRIPTVTTTPSGGTP
jgi:anti-sigma factor RsiW